MNAERIVTLLKELAIECRPLFATETKPAAPNPNELLTVKEACVELGINRETIRKLVLSGAIMRAPDIREIRIKRSELTRYGTRNQ